MKLPAKFNTGKLLKVHPSSSVQALNKKTGCNDEKQSLERMYFTFKLDIE